ncbi:hypothetical protein ACGFX4_23675 [Kitasatospora sp. NPDC048365]|uniref:hypothetical protein n=1 Tax=Kitasatospora sp. NPDC048365 TaxID=3364050 RepID=UPI00371C8097
MAGIDDGRPAVLQPCPGCGLADELAGVPAVYHAGRDTVRVTTPARFDEPANTVTRAVTTSLAAALSPVPPTPLRLPPFGHWFAGVFLVLVSVGTFIGGALAGHWFSEDRASGEPQGYPFDAWPVEPAPGPDLAFLGWISALALLAAIAVFVRIAVRRPDRRQPPFDPAAAERLWSRGWYCRRCGCVHFRAEPGREARALTLQEFRAEVWAAGGWTSA